MAQCICVAGLSLFSFKLTLYFHIMNGLLLLVCVIEVSWCLVVSFSLYIVRLRDFSYCHLGFRI